MARPPLRTHPENDHHTRAALTRASTPDNPKAFML